ncbi:hypothetical protein [Gordonia terrae]|uniref:hypothetical protein n=1 Tax=Gordonia terrae TaxID=2055 RepID=UPI003F6C7D5B
MPTSVRRTRLWRFGTVAALATIVATGLGACSSDDSESDPPVTSALSSPTATSVPRPAPAGSPQPTASDAASSAAASMTCKEFRALDDRSRTEAVTELGAGANAGQVATVAATVCLSRPGDKLSDVVDELLGR